MVRALATAIYRDPSGTIIGGSHSEYIDRSYFPSGPADGSITVTGWWPATVDPSRVEVYLTRVG
jgi:hypothetical protein